MTIHRPIIAAAFAFACVSTAAAQVPVAPVAPPAPPAAQAPAPAPVPAPRVYTGIEGSLDGHYVDFGSFDFHGVAEHARAIAESALDFHRFEFAQGAQI